MLAIFLVLAFTFTGKVSAKMYDTNMYQEEPEEPEKNDGSPSKPCKGKCKGKD